MLYDLTELKSLFGDDLEALNELLTNFTADAAVSLHKINEACISGNISVIEGELHKFAGMVTSLHVTSIKGILKNIEKEIHENGLDAANLSNIKLITNTIGSVIDHLKTEITA